MFSKTGAVAHMSKDISHRSQLIHDIHDYGISPDTREIYLHGYLGESEEEAGVAYRMAVRFEALSCRRRITEF